ARTAARAHGAPRRLVVAHPSTELYGADLQMLETLRAARAGGWDVELVLPGDGPLTARAAALGVRVTRADLPVLRKSLLHPARLPGLALAAVRSVVRTTRTLRRTRPDLVYVSTLTIPWWVVAARLARVPVLCHVHEAEEDQPRVVTAALTAPLLLADRVVTNSAAARRSIGPVFGSLAERAVVVHNGVPGPADDPAPPAPGGPLRVALVGRLSPRKGTDVALEAVAQAVARGHDLRLRVAGSTFTGYEWFERELRARLDEPALAGRVELLGFVHPTWPLLAEADVVLVPSRVEPFGNTAVEAMLAGRAVVASRVQGLAEILRDGETGLLVPPGDAAALADALARLDGDPALRARLAAAARADALTRFSPERYAVAVRAELDRLAPPRPAAAPEPEPEHEPEPALG
ncbi:glycosyltransferase, partial [Cellulomonas sp. 179-A 9B4 NHS]|uniref:glycosyltransferase n=1 Tax=Cellulomonas sp. 179-A 9B4 NHS TaxID=3142379 RepID=UPI0039A17AA3